MRATKVLLAVAVLVGSVVVAGSAPAGAATVTIDAKVASTSIELGQSVAVTGKVTPRATSRVVVQRSLGRGVWSDRAAGSVAADGTFSVSIRPSAAGLYALRVRSGGGTVKSKTLYLKVRFGPGQAIRATNWSTFRYGLCPDPAFEDGGSPAYGDLNGDRVEEAVVTLWCGSGGTAYYMQLAVYDWRGGKPHFLSTWDPTGLPTDWAPNITSVSIARGFVTVKGTYSPRGSCHACHTGRWSRVLALHGERLVYASPD